MHANIVIIAYMKSTQMTIRRVSEKVSQKLREAARIQGKSLNQVALEALEKGLGLTEDAVEYHDLDDLAGTWIDDPEFDLAIAAMDKVDAELWK
jgi:hypothetical protein